MRQSKFFMARCLIAIAHEDNIMHDHEAAYLAALFRHLNFNENEWKILNNAFVNAEDIALLLPKILDDNQKLQLIFLSRLLTIKDGALHIKESSLLKKIDKYLSHDIDVEKIHHKANDFLKKHKYLERACAEGVIQDGRLISWLEICDMALIDIKLDLLE